MPTWLTGALVNVRIATSAGESPRKTQTSPVRVTATASSRLIADRRCCSGTKGVLRVRTFWKMVGLAGLAGVAATGVAVARAERRRAAYTPDQVRARLHERYREIPPR